MEKKREKNVKSKEKKHKKVKKKSKKLICEICHNEADELFTCQICGVKFCKYCGDPKRLLCEDCLSAEAKLEGLELEETSW